jgi:cytochrome c556
MGRTAWSVALGLAVAGVVGSAVAQDIIAKRQEEMKALGQRMGTFKAVLVDKSGGSLDDVKAGARYLAEKAPLIPSWFPAGTGEGKTDAMPAIWEKPAEFEAKAKTMADLAMALEAAAQSGDAAAATAAFATLGREGCGGCHSVFRKPEEQSYKKM